MANNFFEKTGREGRTEFSDMDVISLFALLEDLYQGKRLFRDRRTIAIWREVLKPWDYPTVRDAVIRRARENRYLPDPSEVAEYCPKQEAVYGTDPSEEGRIRENMERMKRILSLAQAEDGGEHRTVIITAEITYDEYGNREGPFDEDRLRRKAEGLKARLDADDVVVLKMQEFGGG